MGGGYYDRDVQVASNNNNKGYSDVANKVLAVNKNLHKSMDPSRYKEEPLECDGKNPIVFALDVTGSMGDWTKIMIQKYLDEPSISFCAIGDATSDDAPLQITEFGQGKEIDQLIGKMYLEGGGGGNQHESYELAALFYTRNCEFKNSDQAFFFITGDELYFDKIEVSTMKKLMGKDFGGEKINAKSLWEETKKKYNLFLLHKPYYNKKWDAKISKEWVDTLGRERVLEMLTPKACIDVILGAIAITSKKRTLKTYIDDMMDRGQDNDRIAEVTNALSNYAKFIGAYDINDPKDKIANVKEEIIPNLMKHDSMKMHADLVDSLKDLKKILGKEIPEEFFCPITGEILVEPVITMDGNTYEKAAIEQWLEKHDTSPLTNVKLPSKETMPNHALKKLIMEYYEANKGKIKN